MRKRRLLFACGRNVDRSPTAEHLFDGAERVEAKSAGVSVGATVRLTKELMEWADTVFVMERRHSKAALKIAPKCWKKTEIFDGQRIRDSWAFNIYNFQSDDLSTWRRRRTHTELAITIDDVLISGSLE